MFILSLLWVLMLSLIYPLMMSLLNADVPVAVDDASFVVATDVVAACWSYALNNFKI